ncbi:MAG: hypothetical protein HY964_09030 [Ignavibacteriales bacterium]|nr:hypothetical protein [Ignavibacteriales bacterium]
MRTIKDISYLKIFGIVLPILFLLLSCKEKGTEPPIFQPGKRNYQWTVDTLYYPGSNQIYMQDMWASSSKNVYVAGHNSEGFGQMYRFDGSSWSVVRLHVLEGGTIGGNFSLWAMDGSDEKNVWAAGDRYYVIDDKIVDSSFVIRYDGNIWQAVHPSNGRGLNCIWSYSPTVVFTGDREGNIFRYNGTNWIKYDMGKEYYFSSIAGISPSEVYAIGRRNDKTIPIDSTGIFLFRFNGTSWLKIDSCMSVPNAPEPHFGGRLSVINGILYSGGENSFKYNNGKWEKIFTGEVWMANGFGPTHIFAVGTSVYHFNGVDWYEYTQFRSSWLTWWDSYTNMSEVFILGTTGYKSFVLHGK